MALRDDNRRYSLPDDLALLSFLRRLDQYNCSPLILYLCYYLETLIMQPENNEQIIALKAFAKALKIKFISEENPSPGGDQWFLDPDNIAEVKEGIQDKQFTKIDDAKNIWPNILL